MSDTIIQFKNEILFRKSFSIFGSGCGIVLIFLENIHPCFVYTGILKFVENDHQLAFILGHEIAHSLLDHTAEEIKYLNFLYGLFALPMALLWAFSPIDMSFCTGKVFSKVMKICVLNSTQTLG